MRKAKIYGIAKRSWQHHFTFIPLWNDGWRSISMETGVTAHGLERYFKEKCSKTTIMIFVQFHKFTKNHYVEQL